MKKGNLAKGEARLRRINKMRSFVLQHPWLNALLAKISVSLRMICDISDLELEGPRSISSQAAVVFKRSTGEYGIRLTKVDPRSTFENRTRYVIVVNPDHYQTPKLVADDKAFEEIRIVTVPGNLERAILKSAASSHTLNGWEGYIRSALNLAEQRAA